MSELKPQIECTPNGPYKATNLGYLKSTKGEIETNAVVYLCRCGGSSKKPFCDGTHAKNGFSDIKKDDRTPNKKENYSSGEIIVSDNRGTCAHAGYCTNGLPSVFRQKEEPFVEPAADLPENIAKVINQCPSGALRFNLSGHSDQPSNSEVFIAPNGPYACSNIELKAVLFNEGANPNRYTLCRCGQSKNKPFCNGAHWNFDFDK